MTCVAGFALHPYNEIFPMMTDEELEGLAEAIKAVGLLNPIVLDQRKGDVLGRRRLGDVKPYAA
jgi:ParB-like chromosome segregation protein Spo0J